MALWAMWDALDGMIAKCGEPVEASGVVAGTDARPSPGVDAGYSCA
jgi:hypothetical protein